MTEKHKIPFRLRFCFTGSNFHQAVRDAKNISIYIKIFDTGANLTINIFLLPYALKKKLPIHRKFPLTFLLSESQVILLRIPHKTILRKSDSFHMHKTNNNFLPLG